MRQSLNTRQTMRVWALIFVLGITAGCLGTYAQPTYHEDEIDQSIDLLQDYADSLSHEDMPTRFKRDDGGVT